MLFTYIYICIHTPLHLKENQFVLLCIGFGVCFVILNKIPIYSRVDR